MFGSKARGDFSINTDIDIAIETKEPLSKLTLIGPFDFVKLNAINDKSLKDKIRKEGIIIYER